MALTTSYANSILSGIFSGAQLALSLTAPTAAGGNVTEPPASANYARVSGSAFTAANKQISNPGYIYFPEATSAWGTVAYLCVYSGTTLRYYGALTSAVVVAANSVPLFRPGTINISLDT